jgi:hypothetical protein
MEISHKEMFFWRSRPAANRFFIDAFYLTVTFNFDF